VLRTALLLLLAAAAAPPAAAGEASGTPATRPLPPAVAPPPVSPPALAPGNREAPPAPAPLQTADDPIFSVLRHRLSNGFEIFVKPRSTTRAVDLRVLVKVGFRHEATRDSGLSHLLEHMMFKGTRRHDEIALNRIVEGKGAYANGETWPELTLYEVNIVDAHWPLALDWLREIVLESELSAEDLAQARDDVYSEQEGDYPRYVEALFETGLFQPIELKVPDTLFPAMELPDRVISRLEHVDERRLRAHYERFYAPGNMALVVVGNVDPQAVLARATAAFGSLPARPVTAPDLLPTLAPLLPAGEIDTDLMPPVGQMTEVWRGVVTGGLGDPDRFTLRVIQTWLDRRIFEEIRSRRALGYSLGCRVQEVSDVGLLYGFARVRRDGEAEETARRILAELFASLVERPLPAGELQEAKDTILGRQARQLESNAALASLYQEWFLRIPYGEPLPSYFAEIAKVTAADVQRVARARFTPAATFTAVARPTLSFTQATVVLGGLAVVLGLLLARRRLKLRRERRARDVPPATA
jgi:predicted Zn-dependent peptidase